MSEQNIFPNALKEGYSGTDYKIGSAYIKCIPLNTNTERFYYNQARKIGDVGLYYSCGLHMCIGAISNLFGYRFTDEEIKDIVLLAMKEYGLDNDGMVFYKAVDCLRNWWNANKSKEFGAIKSFQTFIGSDIFYELLDKNHRVCVGYNTTTEYYQDTQDNGIVDSEEVGTIKGGHGVSMTKKEVPDNITYPTAGLVKQIDDNYIGVLKYNSYVNEKIEILQEKGMFFKNCYYFLKDEDVNQIVLDNLEFKNAKVAYVAGFTNGLNPKENIQREEVMAMIGSLYEKINPEEYKRIIDEYNL